MDFYLRQRGRTADGAPCEVSRPDDECRDVFGNVNDEAYCTQSPGSYGGRKVACRQEEYTEVEKISDVALFCTSRTFTQAQDKAGPRVRISSTGVDASC